MVMNHRKISDDTCTQLFTQILEKIDKAGSNETFYLAMALARGLNRKITPEMVPKYSDLVYSIYVQSAVHINALDLYQLG